MTAVVQQPVSVTIEADQSVFQSYKVRRRGAGRAPLLVLVRNGHAPSTVVRPFCTSLAIWLFPTISSPTRAERRDDGQVRHQPGPRCPRRRLRHGRGPGARAQRRREATRREATRREATCAAAPHGRMGAAHDPRTRGRPHHTHRPLPPVLTAGLLQGQELVGPVVGREGERGRVAAGAGGTRVWRARGTARRVSPTRAHIAPPRTHPHDRGTSAWAAARRSARPASAGSSA